MEERLDLIHNLTRKYGGSIPAVIAFAEDARKQLETISDAADRIEELESEESKLLDKLAKQGGSLSDKRKQAASAARQRHRDRAGRSEDGGRAVRRGLSDQAGPGRRACWRTARVAFDQNGLDRVEFLVAPNPGEGLKPLAKIASGGETSRLMLALKNVLARADQIPTPDLR